MKHFIRDICVFLFSVSGLTSLYRKRVQKYPLVRVVSFHDVSDAQWFRSVVKLLVTRFNVLTPAAFHDGTELASDTINVLITFDDGYESWITTCLPVLREYQVKALFFINSGLLDAASNTASSAAYMLEKLRTSPKRPLTWEMARLLISEGHTIGGHSVNHKSLRHVNPEELRFEVGEDKNVIEKKLGIAIHDFAYPFGIGSDYSNETENRIRGIGYRYIYTAEPGFVKSISAHIPRLLIEKNQSEGLVYRWIWGSYDLFTFLRKKIAFAKKSVFK